MTITAEQTNERIAATILNNANEFNRSRPPVATDPITIQLFKLMPTGEGDYTVVKNGSLNKSPTLRAYNPTKLVAPVAEGEELTVLLDATEGFSEVPTNVLWELLERWATTARPNAQECITLSRGLNMLAATRRGIEIKLGDLP